MGIEEEKSDIKSYQRAGWRWETSGVALGMNFPDMVGLCSGLFIFSCVCFFDAFWYVSYGLLSLYEDYIYENISGCSGER